MIPPEGEDLIQENAALRDRLLRLSEASLRINESLDFDTVLQGVLDSARSLTGARYGVVTLLDDSGALQDFHFSGMSELEAELFQQLPEGMQLFEYLSSLPQPLRLPDLLEHIRSTDLLDLQPPVAVGPVVPFLAAPVLHQGERVGNFFLAKIEPGAEFSQEDEETLTMFAAQAAMVVANARRHRDEQRARNDLQTLIDTSPVGVAVFDARTGAPLSFNREALRIAGELSTPDQSPAQLLEALTIRRGDGREVSLQELPLSRALSIGETIRAEEIVLQVPDGRKVAVLVNATPIRSEAGEVRSFVVTLQDLTPLEELERLRAEFLAMVSHELRTPLAAVKGSITTLLDVSAALSSAETVQFHQIIDAQTDRMRELISDLLDVARIEMGTLSISPEPTDLSVLVEDARRAFLSGGRSNRLQLYIDLAPGLPWVMADRLRIVQVLGNLLSNAARHSDESSAIRLTAVRDGFHVAVSVSDDGRGILPEHLPHLFRKFTSAPDDSRGDGAERTGLGLAICKGIIEAHGGRIWAESDGPGLGARFTFTVPVAEAAVTGAASPHTAAVGSPHPEEQEKPRILAVDDDPQTLRHVRDALSRAGYVPVVTGDPQEALLMLREQQLHLVLLDLALPGTDGIELMGEIADIADVPVIFLSAYGREENVTQALDMGAVDYIVKPFSPMELAARIRAALRKREATPEPPTTYELGDLAIHFPNRMVTFAGRPTRLTSIEYRLLAELAANAGRVLTYDHLLLQVWGKPSDSDVRPMRTAISSIRRKLGDNSDHPTYIFTDPRVGYWMPRAEEAAEASETEEADEASETEEADEASETAETDETVGA